MFSENAALVVSPSVPESRNADDWGTTIVKQNRNEACEIHTFYRNRPATGTCNVVTNAASTVPASPIIRNTSSAFRREIWSGETRGGVTRGGVFNSLDVELKPRSKHRVVFKCNYPISPEV